jgi:hypothetical protein
MAQPDDTSLVRCFGRKNAIARNKVTPTKRVLGLSHLPNPDGQLSASPSTLPSIRSMRGYATSISPHQLP